MTNITRKYVLLSASFILIPPVSAGLLIWTVHALSVDTQAAVLSNIMWPTMSLVCLAALIGWAGFMRPTVHLPNGTKAGCLAVFLCYAFCSGPLAIEAGSWDGFLGVLRVYFAVFVFGQIATFWMTYPIGTLFGRWIAKRMV